MTDTSGKNLTREKMQQILAAIGSRPAEDTADNTAEQYNWHQPNYFSAEQLKKIDGFTEKITASVADKFHDLCHSDFDVKLACLTMHFAEELVGQILDNEPNNYYLAFGTEQDPKCAAVTMPPETAAIWIALVLGESEPLNSSRELSQLEESILLDTASAIVKALDESYPENAGKLFHHATGIIRKQLPLALPGSQETCKITFNIEQIKSKKSSQAYVLIPCTKLDAVAGKDSQAADKLAPKDASKKMLEHLNEMTVSVKAQIGSMLLTFEEAFSLGLNDILLLNKNVNEPVDVYVGGQKLFRGWPAKAAGTYAVLIKDKTES